MKSSAYEATHPSFANSYGRLASVLYKLKDYGTALEYSLKAVEIYKKAFGEIYSQLETEYKFISLTYQKLKQPEKSLQYRTRALYIKVSIRGEINEEVANSYANLAREYCRLEKYQKALEFQLKAVNIKRVVYGEDHRQTEAEYNTLELIYERIRGSQQEKIIYDLTSVDISQFVSEESFSTRAEDEMKVEIKRDSDRIRDKY